MNVLSLFDGMSGARVALERMGVEIKNYYASEIDKYCLQISQKNYPDNIQLGDVTKIDARELPPIDLLIGGSPCQGFSVAGKGLNFEDPRSQLFFEYVRLLKEIKPKYFLLENVRMKKEWCDVITDIMGVQPILINSALVSAQNRNRLYWTNIPGVEQPADKEIMLKDIVHENECVDCKYALSEKENGYMLRGNEKWQKAGKCRLDRYLQYDNKKAFTVTSNIHRGVPYNCFYQHLNKYIVPFDKTLQILDKETERGRIGHFKSNSQGQRVYYIHNKSVALCGLSGGRGAKTGLYLFGCITPDRINKRQNGQRFSEGKKFYTLTAQDRHGILIEGYIRKLTPIECERLQTFPDDYTAGVSNSQRYKMLGNGFTVDVIAHILSHIPKDHK